jgi:hypothetical protein
MCFLVYCLFVNNTVVPWLFHKYFSTMQFPPILTIPKIWWLFLTPRHFEYWLHEGLWNAYFYFLLSSSPHIRLHLRALFAKPMFKVNKPLLIPKNTLVTWHNIWWHVMEYFPCHLKFSTWKTNIKKDSMTWHGIFSKILSCSCEPTHLLVSLGTNMPPGIFLNFWRGEPIGWCKHAPKGCFFIFLKGWGLDFPSSSQKSSH